MLEGVSGGKSRQHAHRDDCQGYGPATAHQRRADHSAARFGIESAQRIVVDLFRSVSVCLPFRSNIVHTRRNSSLGLVGPHFPHLAARSRSGWFAGCASWFSPPALFLCSLFTAAFKACAPYSLSQASPGARAGSSATRDDTLSLEVQSRMTWSLTRSVILLMNGYY